MYNQLYLPGKYEGPAKGFVIAIGCLKCSFIKIIFIANLYLLIFKFIVLQFLDTSVCGKMSLWKNKGSVTLMCKAIL